MDEVGCYVAFPEVRNVILITTALAVALIYWLAKAVRSRRERRAARAVISVRTGARRRQGMRDLMATRPTAPFTVFYRTASGEGGFICRSCALHRSDLFPRASDAFAVATQHLNLCRAAVRHRPVEGSAIIDGVMHAAVLREGIMILAVDAVFNTAPMPVRVVV
jgi:hypothetical protein